MSDTESGGEQGEVTAEELQAVQSPEDITERLKPYFEPNYDSIADDTSYAEVSDTLSDEPAEGAEAQSEEEQT